MSKYSARAASACAERAAGCAQVLRRHAVAACARKALEVCCSGCADGSVEGQLPSPFDPSGMAEAMRRAPSASTRRPGDVAAPRRSGRGQEVAHQVWQVGRVRRGSQRGRRRRCGRAARRRLNRGERWLGPTAGDIPDGGRLGRPRQRVASRLAARSSAVSCADVRSPGRGRRAKAAARSSSRGLASSPWRTPACTHARSATGCQKSTRGSRKSGSQGTGSVACES